MVAHLLCLSHHFLYEENRNTKVKQIVPIIGKCPLCFQELKWGKLITDMKHRQLRNVPIHQHLINPDDRFDNNQADPTVTNHSKEHKNSCPLSQNSPQKAHGLSNTTFNALKNGTSYSDAVNEHNDNYNCLLSAEAELDDDTSSDNDSVDLLLQEFDNSQFTSKIVIPMNSLSISK
ncbi:hypothetical protein BC833DRAFT_589265, partial [Globomyces pollinis-pini]